MMDCPKCTTKGKPTQMHPERILVGGGSGLERNTGLVHNEFNDVYRCYQCGSYKVIDVKPIPYSVLVERENYRIKEQKEQEKRDAIERAELEKQQKAEEIQRLQDEENKKIDSVLQEYRDSVIKALQNKTSWNSIAKLLSVVTGKELCATALQTAWGALTDKGV